MTLSFSGSSERLLIPFAAVTGFADPSAKFGLQFQITTEEAEAEEGPPHPDPNPAGPNPAGPNPAGGDDSGGKVVALDAFRKK